MKRALSTPFESEGATPTMFAEGEIPEKSEGETPKNTEEKTLKPYKGETPSMFAEGEIPGMMGHLRLWIWTMCQKNRL